MKSTYSYEQEIVKKMLNLVSNKVGFISHVFTKKCLIDSKNITHGQIPNCYISCVNTNIAKDIGVNLVGGGSSISKNRSIIKAIGEFIERYCALECYEIIRHESIENIKSENIDYIDIRELLHFSDEQYQEEGFPFEKYNPDDKICWVAGKNLTSKKEILIPAQKVYFHYSTDKKEKNYDIRLSTGLACGDSLENAIISGLYECIERDAFYLTWSCMLSGKKIILDNIKNCNLKKLLNILEMSSYGTLHIVDISLDTSVYTILTILENSNGVGISVAAASNLDPEVALLKSLEELILTHSYAVEIYENEFDSNYPDIKREDIFELDHHIHYYINPHNNKIIEFLTKNKKYINLSELKNNSLGNTFADLELIVNELNEIGSQVVYSEITEEDIKHIGFRVVKVIATKLNNIDVIYNARHLGNKRMMDIINSNNSKINEEPHPFP